MSHSAAPHDSDLSDTYAGETTGWLGWVLFAGTMMILLGCFHALAGLVALFKDDVYLVPDRDLILSVDYSAWGWIHLILGVIVAGAGAGLIRGATWARVVAVLLAVLSAIACLAFMSAYPIWAAIMIAFAVLVIYAVTVHGGEAKAL